MNAKMNEETTREENGNEAVVNRLLCATLDGVSAHRVEVEATLTKGLPGFAVVGLASSDIQEAKERVKSALQTNGFSFPPLKITVNLSPSDLSKKGTQFDLSLALLIALHESAVSYEDVYVFGELGLDGKVKNTSQLFPIILSLKEQGRIRRAVVPASAMEHLKHIHGVAFYPVETLQEALQLLQTGAFKEAETRFQIDGEAVEVEDERYYFLREYPEDFKEVKGQRVAKRAALIAAAGMHNFFMEGNPGCGKSMIARRLPYILPPVSETELLSIAKHRFLNGQTPDFKPVRPFRAPHHTATSASIFGGGSGSARIGEVALAHHGMLFFDEVPHFAKTVLEALREPLQDRKVHIARVNAKVEYDADVMFVAAQNPCPCGNLLSKHKTCRCNEREIQRYRNKLSDPFLDRIDLFVTMQEVQPDDKADIDSHTMHEAVLRAFVAQKKRKQPRLNGKLSQEEIERYCVLDKEAAEVLEKAALRFALSHRAMASLKKVARTIADLEGHERITRSDMLEALSYRRR
jgi:magnesium chelatase family protein